MKKSYQYLATLLTAAALSQAVPSTSYAMMDEDFDLAERINDRIAGSIPLVVAVTDSLKDVTGEKAEQYIAITTGILQNASGKTVPEMIAAIEEGTKGMLTARPVDGKGSVLLEPKWWEACCGMVSRAIPSLLVFASETADMFGEKGERASDIIDTINGVFEPTADSLVNAISAIKKPVAAKRGVAPSGSKLNFHIGVVDKKIKRIRRRRG